MKGCRIGAIAAVLALLVGLIPRVAHAQAPNRRVEIRLGGFFSTLTEIGSSGTQFARGNSTLYGGQLNVYYPNSGCGFGGE
jgi:hypothetical protein